MAFKKGEIPPGATPFKKGQSGNPGGRPKANAPMDEWRRRNADALQEIVDADEAKDVWMRWFYRFKAGKTDALWMVPYLFGPPPKESKQTIELTSQNENTTTIEVHHVRRQPDPRRTAGAAPGAGAGPG